MFLVSVGVRGAAKRGRKAVMNLHLKHTWMLTGLLAAILASGAAAQSIPERYQIELPRIPADDRSGELGPRLLKLLRVVTERNLQCMERDRRAAGLDDGETIVDTSPSRYFRYFVGGSAYALAVLTRFDESGETVGHRSRDDLRRLAVSMIRAVVRTHKLGGGQAEWNRFRSARELHLLGTGAWLLWDRLDAETRLLVAQILEYEADRFLDAPAPARLHGNTQAESNAWTAGGLAVAACMLKSHPHHPRWAAKANEYMISAYATAQDAESEEPVDGRPLKTWLSGPNALPDYTVENHGFIHTDYLAAISEMVRSAVAYRLADLPLPQAATFNADKVFDLLAFLLLPDGSHLYPQGTDYTPRRLDSFFQVCNLVPLRPDPLRKTCFLRALDSLEKMAAERPELPMSGWIGSPYNLSITWGLTQNYLMCRLYGDGGTVLPDDGLEKALAGVRVFEFGQFVVHRTAETLSSFSWHHRAAPPRVMGLTMPLDRDVLCYPMPGSYLGDVREHAADAPTTVPVSLKLLQHKVDARDDGFSVLASLERCSGKVRQNCAFVSLPEGASVYLEERTAVGKVEISLATSGNVVIFDDPRWVYQSGPRKFFGKLGELSPAATPHEGSWLNVDDRLGYVSLGATRVRLEKRPGRPAIFRGSNTMYDTCRLEFLHVAPEVGLPSAEFRDGERIGAFVLVSCPNQTAKETAAVAERIDELGWQVNQPGLLAAKVDGYLVYANFSLQTEKPETGSANCPQ
jgi:hypothetical protein